MNEELTEAKVAEAAHAAAVAHEANANAREAQTRETLYDVMREILTEGDEGTKKLLIQKIPLLCTDMLSMKKDVQEIKTHMSWHRWLLLGIAGGIGLIALKTLGGV